MKSRLNLNKQINNICRKISSGNALNYCCDVEVFYGELSTENDPKQTLKVVMGNNFSVDNIKVVTIEEIINEITESLSHRGDDGYYPNLKYVESHTFRKDLQNLSKNIERQLDTCKKMYSFYVKSGHPFYPVFWEFAFLVIYENKASVFIGSSSD